VRVACDEQMKRSSSCPTPQGTPSPHPFANAVGVVLPSVRELHDEVFSDLDDKTYGVGWWAPHPGTSRRILISDQLLMCIASIETNLVEAALHLMELRDFDEQQDRIIARAVQHDRQGRPSIKMPARERAADDLPDRMAALHVAGFFRAVGSALDCLGAATVGVLALPTSILKADLDRAIVTLGGVSAPSTDGEKIQAGFRTELEQIVAAAGPPGWLPWATDYRNMLVHRGRRLEVSSLTRRGALLYAADETPVMLARSVRQLPQDPGLSEVEVLVPAAALVLTENAAATLEGVMASTLALSDRTAAALIAIWKRRRADPRLLTQPKEQWRAGRSSSSRGFAGYKPGTAPSNFDALVSHPTFVRRHQAAALDAGARKKWDTFD
jgi:hypothetical protein